MDNSHDFHQIQYLWDVMWISNALFHSLPSSAPNRSPWTFSCVCKGKTNCGEPMSMELQHEFPLNLVYLKHASIVLNMLIAECKTVLSPLLAHWRYCSLALSFQFIAVSVLSCAIHELIHGLPTVKPKFCYANFPNYCTEFLQMKFPWNTVTSMCAPQH